MHIAIVDEELPYPPDSGKRIRTLKLILPLASRHRIAYICHPSASPRETAEAVMFFQEHGIEPVLVPRILPKKSGPAFYGRLLRNLGSPLPYSVQVHNSRALRRTIRDYAAAHDVDLWHCEWTPYGESLARVVRGPWLIMAHNVESLIWQRYCENESNPLKRWYIERQWRKFEQFEQRMFSTAPLVVAVSERDAQLMRDCFAAERVEVVDNGVDIDDVQPDGAPRDPTHLLFLGSLDWRPNLDALDLLLDSVFPRVLAAHPSARLSVVGRKPSLRLRKRLAACPRVELHADVPDVRPFLHGCGLLIVPLRIGGGSRLKILEALAAGCPVVSTPVGAEGLRLEPGRHFVEAETPAELAAAVLEHVRSPSQISKMAEAGRRVAVAHYHWPALSARLEAIWLRQAGGRQPLPDRREGSRGQEVFVPVSGARAGETRL